VSKARLVITAVVVEGRSQHEVARAYGLSQSWISRLVARFSREGEAAFEPRSRRPKRSPTAIPQAAVELICRLRLDLTSQGLDAGPDTIAWHLAQHHSISVSTASVSRYLSRAGLVLPTPAKRPRSSYIRFQAALPNECWQADFTHYRLTRSDAHPGSEVEILSWLDDCSRYALSITAYLRVTGPSVVATFRDAVNRFGAPASTLTDNGMVFTTRLAGGRGGRNGFEAELRRLNVRQKNSRPNHPTTCGKVERFHIGVGRTHARTPVILLVQDLDIRVVHASTGELLRALTLDPSRSYQPTGRPPGPPPRNAARIEGSG